MRICFIISMIYLSLFTLFVPAATQKKVPSSAFFITKDGYAVTNYSSVYGAEKIEGIINGKPATFSFVAGDFVDDLAVIKIDQEVNVDKIPLLHGTIKESEKINNLSFVKIKDVLQNQAVISSGYVNALTGIKKDIRYFQARFNKNRLPKNGPVINKHGACVGFISGKNSDLYAFLEEKPNKENVSLVTKVEYLFPLIKDIKGVEWTQKDSLNTQSFEPSQYNEAVFVLDAYFTDNNMENKNVENFMSLRAQIPENSLFISISVISGYQGAGFAKVLLPSLKEFNIGKTVDQSLKQKYYKSIYEKFGQNSLTADEIVKMAADLAGGYYLEASCNVVSGDVEDSVELILYKPHTIKPLSKVKVVKVINSDPEIALKELTTKALSLMAKDLKEKKVTF